LRHRVALYPGSFDPVHKGHMDIAARAAELFDHLVIGVYDRPSKALLFSTEERVALVRQVMADHPNVEVLPYSGLTVSFARDRGAMVLVRGLRLISDFELEYQMAMTNHQLHPELETICLMTRYEYAFLSSSVIKEICMAGGDVSLMVHPVVLEALLRKREQPGGRRESVPMVSLRD